MLSAETQKLIINEFLTYTRPDFTLRAEYAAELLLQTYDLFGIKRPEQVIWCKSPTDKLFLQAERKRQACRDRATRPDQIHEQSPTTSRLALIGFRHPYCSDAWRERQRRIRFDPFQLRASIRNILEFYPYVFDHHRTCAPSPKDITSLRYLQLLTEATEAGAGYWTEAGDTLLIAPTPLVRVDTNFRFHSITGPAIRFEGADEYYYFRGVQGLVIDSLWKRRADGSRVNYQLYRFRDGLQLNQTRRGIDVCYVVYDDIVKSGRRYMSGVPICRTVAQAMAWKFSDRRNKLTPEEWRQLRPGIEMA